MRTIKSMTDDLMADVQRNYKKNGHIQPAVFIVRKGKPSMLQAEILELFARDKEEFLKRFRGILKKEKPDAVMISFGVSYTDDLKDAKSNKEFAFIFANTNEKQTTYVSEMSGKRMGKWREFGVCDKVSHGTWLGGNFIVLYGLGTVMDVPKVDG